MPDPLPIPPDHWRSRWLHPPASGTLHRVASIAWDDGMEWIAGEGATVCGHRGRLLMPGIVSRMEAPRCARCCRALGISPGYGAPVNALTGQHKHA